MISQTRSNIPRMTKIRPTPTMYLGIKLNENDNLFSKCFGISMNPSNHIPGKNTFGTFLNNLKFV